MITKQSNLDVNDSNNNYDMGNNQKAVGSNRLISNKIKIYPHPNFKTHNNAPNNSDFVVTSKSKASIPSEFDESDNANDRSHQFNFSKVNTLVKKLKNLILLIIFLSILNNLIYLGAIQSVLFR